MVDIIFFTMGIIKNNAIHTSHSPYSFGNDIVLRIFSGDQFHMTGLSHIANLNLLLEVKQVR